MMDLEEQINFTNKFRHPTNDRKTVYRFFNPKQTERFTELLVDNGIEFEAQIDDEHPKKPTYFGVAVAVETKVDKLNNLALGEGRDKFIAAAPIRWIVIAISIVTILLAVMGALLSR